MTSSPTCKSAAIPAPPAAVNDPEVALVLAVVPETAESADKIIVPVPFGSIVILPFVFSLIRLFALIAKFCPEPAPVTAYNSTKLSFTLSNAVRSGSPVPSFAYYPMLIVCIAISISP